MPSFLFSRNRWSAAFAFFSLSSFLPKNQLLLASLLLGNIVLSAQPKVQWADKVIRVSSELEYSKAPRQYRAEQVLGVPSVLPQFGLSEAAWTPAREQASQEYLSVGFSKPSFAQQVLINENYNAGAITKVFISDGGSQKKLVYENEAPQALPEGRLLQIKLERSAFPVAEVLVLLNTNAVKGYNQIDAIGIADHQEEVEVRIRNLGTKSDLKVENLGAAVNSSAMELAPLISPDGGSLYFVREGHPENTKARLQNIWVSALDKQAKPTAARNIGKPLNGNLNSALLSISPDGQTALLNSIYGEDGRGRPGLSVSQRTREGWSQPRTLNIKNYYSDNRFREVSMSSSGQVLILSLQRKEAGLGGKDLFVSFKEGPYTWSEPLWMGPSINSGGAEAAPFLAADGKSVYFASNGFPGYGSMDVFVSRRLDDSWTNWSEPENLGKPLNTESWDAYYSLPASGDYLYMVSSKDGGYGKGDIYRAKLPKALRPQPVVLITGQVKNRDTEAGIGTAINYYNLKTGKLVGTASSDPQTGAYRIILPAGNSYGFSAQKSGFVPVSENINLEALDDYEEQERDLLLQPLREGATIALNNIYFNSGKAILREASKVELHQLLELIQAQPSLQVEIGGHTDDIGKDSYNQELSERRAKAVVDYLIEAGISSERLQAKGYGESQPKVDNNSDAQRQKNRRVEFKILRL